mgnify:FL=1
MTKSNWIMAVLALIAVLYMLNALFSSPEKKSKSAAELKLERQTQDVKNCVQTLGKGVYKDKSLSWKLSNCNASD